jgi:hypothetical protein
MLSGWRFILSRELRCSHRGGDRVRLAVALSVAYSLPNTLVHKSLANSVLASIEKSKT